MGELLDAIQRARPRAGLDEIVLGRLTAAKLIDELEAMNCLDPLTKSDFLKRGIAALRGITLFGCQVDFVDVIDLMGVHERRKDEARDGPAA